MTRPNPVRRVERKDSFKSDFKKLPPEIQQHVIRAIQGLVRDPIPARLRFEKQGGYYTIHVTSNHSHKLSFELDGDLARLRRVGTHKEIDRAP